MEITVIEKHVPVLLYSSDSMDDRWRYVYKQDKENIYYIDVIFWGDGMTSYNLFSMEKTSWRKSEDGEEEPFTISQEYGSLIKNVFNAVFLF